MSAPVGGDWWDSCILAHCLGLCQAVWSLWEVSLVTGTGCAYTSVLSTCSYPSMASSFLSEEIPDLPSCPTDKAQVSADTWSWQCSLPTLITCELILLKHLVSSIPSPASEMLASL